MSQSIDRDVRDLPVGYSNPLRIGRGGFSIVYRARHDRLNREVALKILATDFDDPADERRFETECSALGRLSQHRNVVEVFDAGVTPNGSAFIAMRLYSQGSLAERLRSTGPLAVSQVVEVGVRISSAVQAAHEMGVIHRDIKPENILLGDDGEPLITDFGIATMADADGRFTTSVAFSRAHAAPEVLDENLFGPLSDQYSLGSTMYALLAGKPAFRGATESRQLLAVLNDPVPPLERDDVPADLNTVITRAMSKRPIDRYPSMAAFGAAMNAVAQEREGSSALASSEPPQSGPQSAPPSHVTPGTEMEDRTRRRIRATPSDGYERLARPPKVTAASPSVQAAHVRATEARQDARSSKVSPRTRQGRRAVWAAAGAVVVAFLAAVLMMYEPDPSEIDASTTTPISAVTDTPTMVAVEGCGPAPTPPTDTQSWDAAPEMVITDGTDYQMVLATNCGEIVIDTYADKAPETVNAMLWLALQSYFDSTLCHRLVTEGINVLQCGDPTATGTGGPGFELPDENLPTAEDVNYPAGTVAMANAGPGTSGSQFFIAYEDTTLPPDYTIWGEVSSGLDIVAKIAGAGVAGGGTDGSPAAPIGIETAVARQP